MLITKKLYLSLIALFAMPGIRAAQQEVDCFKAVQDGLDTVKKLITNQNVDVNTIGKDGWTFVTSAFSQQKKEIINYLIEEEADLDKLDGKDRNAIGAATHYMNMDLLKLLKEQNVKVDVDPNQVIPPLMIALYKNDNRALNTEVVTYLIEDLKANANISMNGETPLLSAAYNIEDEDTLLTVATLLIEKGGADISQPPYQGNTPLSVVFQKGYSKVANYFCNQDKDLLKNLLLPISL